METITETQRTKIVTRQDVENYMSESVNTEDWNQRRDNLRRIYEGEESVGAVLSFIDGSGLIVKVLG